MGRPASTVPSSTHTSQNTGNSARVFIDVVSGEDLTLNRRLGTHRAGEVTRRPIRTPSRRMERSGTRATRLPRPRKHGARRWKRSRSPHEVLERAVRLAAAHIPGAFAAGASIHHPHTAPETPETLASHPLALAAEDAQHAHRQGPALHARTHHGVVRVHDMSNERRWPAFTRAARDLGITAAIACDLGHQQDSEATLTVYTTAPAGFDPAAAEYAELLAAHTTAALEAAASVTSLHAAIRSRQAIGEATGILMERHRIDAPAAFDLLARLAAHERQTASHRRARRAHRPRPRPDHRGGPHPTAQGPAAPPTARARVRCLNPVRRTLTLHRARRQDS